MRDQTRTNPVVVFVAAISAYVAAYTAYQVVGWIGVGVLGLLIAFIAVQADMDDAAPIGGQQNTSLYASSFQGQQGMTRTEKAERSAESRATGRALNVAKSIGGLLALVGLLGFFFVQLPR